MPTWSAPPITCSESHDWRRLSHELTVLNPLGQVPLSKTRIRSLDSRGGPTQITMKTGYSDPFFDSLLEGWYVVEAARKQGVGRKLVEAGEGWARSMGCIEIASNTEIWRTGSIEAHLSLGYTEVERDVNFLKKLK